MFGVAFHFFYCVMSKHNTEVCINVLWSVRLDPKGPLQALAWLYLEGQIVLLLLIEASVQGTEAKILLMIVPHNRKGLCCRCTEWQSRSCCPRTVSRQICCIWHVTVLFCFLLFFFFFPAAECSVLVQFLEKVQNTHLQKLLKDYSLLQNAFLSLQSNQNVSLSISASPLCYEQLLKTSVHNVCRRIQTRSRSSG